ncbi:hypothetical protein DFP72DRAFT_1047188 [Ephemerocybe angulata]|uniref:Uncharacterized protein n=1 Tax=Ephemerocybe angulata TaxID=980116 RepID=A0A8H6HSJ5_9AGAR|nr:hypothetical protein DFP72DRAFT_1047188 [Tulosesus angulatus]
MDIATNAFRDPFAPYCLAWDDEIISSNMKPDYSARYWNLSNPYYPSSPVNYASEPPWEPTHPHTPGASPHSLGLPQAHQSHSDNFTAWLEPPSSPLTVHSCLWTAENQPSCSAHFAPENGDNFVDHLIFCHSMEGSTSQRSPRGVGSVQGDVRSSFTCRLPAGHSRSELEATTRRPPPLCATRVPLHELRAHLRAAHGLESFVSEFMTIRCCGALCLEEDIFKHAEEEGCRGMPGWVPEALRSRVGEERRRARGVIGGLEFQSGSCYDTGGHAGIEKIP